MPIKILLMKWLIFCFCLGGNALLLNGCSEDGDKQGSGKSSDAVKVRMAVLFGKEHYLGKKLDWVAGELAKRSKGRFQCEVFQGGVAGGEKESLEDLLLGNIELMAGAGSYFYHYCPELSVLELPLYRWKDREEARKVIKGYWPQFVQIASRKGFYPSGLDSRDYWGVWFKTPVGSLAELENAKFRSVNAELWIEVTKLYGAIPNPMPYGDAYMAFKTGVCDGVVGSVTNAVAANWHEVLKTFVDTRLVLSHSFMVTSKSWLDALPEGLRRIFLQVCEDSEAYNLAEVEKQYEQYREEMKSQGITFIEYQDIDLAALEEATPRFRDQYMKNKGDDVYRFYKEWIGYVEQATGRPQPQVE